MADYAVQFIDEAEQALKSLDAAIQRRIFKRLDWLRLNVESTNPKALTGKLAGLYKLRVGDYRILYEILRGEYVIVVHAVGHRSNIYRSQ